MSARLKLIVAYNGENFAGWQSQTNGNTIQDRLEVAFQRVCGKRVRVHGAGRTDSGVHALGQCAHIDLSDRKLPAARWLTALNAHLPVAIRVLRCRCVSQNFHARFSAQEKRYRYRIWNAPVLSPFENGRAWHIVAPLDFEAMSSAAQKLIGRHDFAHFAANRGKKVESTVRTLRSVKVKRIGDCISLDFEGDGFLYKMVRLLVGALMRIGTGDSSENELMDRLASREKSAPRLVAPAAGLFLVRVRY